MYRSTVILIVLLLICVSTTQSQTKASPQTTPQYEVPGWDTSRLDAKIEGAASKAHAPGASREEKLAAAALYLVRANLFYAAQQPSVYKLALGDFRRVLRLQPDNEEARSKAEQIIEIYTQLGKPVPENGTESDPYNDPALRYKLKPEVITLSTAQPKRTVSNTLPAGVAYIYQIEGEPGRTFELRWEPRDGSVFADVCYQWPCSSLLVGPSNTYGVTTPVQDPTFLRVRSTQPNTTYTLNISLK
jgi:hypothetical protein